MGKKTIRDRVSFAVKQMRRADETQVYLKDLQASDATIKNYLWDLRSQGENLSYETDEYGNCTIYRDANARQGMNKHDVLNRLRNMRHEEIWHIQGEDLQIDIKYCSNIIAGDSQDGLNEAKYLKAVFPDFITVLCLNFSEAKEEHPDRYEDEDEFEIAAQQQETAEPAAPTATVDDDPDVDWRGEDATGEDEDEELI